ncbi:succinyldiaminopimelate transaminase [Sulfurimicrobium lacus]|uniref:Succinyldiaminopimelate transaminase n=1 Tax=Sulfurimicrobium lacus TaxID=2715678 RepID=A0A6F8VDM8_9PROT|nr:succinyldiaminopimelate transaminase [Sulfurimicrobium lacus]BCB27261.1 succinyldiaminopimelate transaminase [Sulfurimicrobium lacus]
MNPNLNHLHSYPFQKLRELFHGTAPNPDYSPVNLSIGEPKHATPAFITQTLTANLAGLANYPTTQGSEALRQSIADWVARRYHVPAPDINKQILPVNGSREALFAFAQAVIDTTRTQPVVISPNPFYQIYEGAALLAGATPHYLNTLPENGYSMEFDRVPEGIWQHTQLVYVCSPGNPTGKVMGLAEWKHLFELSDRYRFVIASDECYSEIYPAEDNPPLGGLEAAHQLGRHDYRRMVMFSSLSKRSNVPGMRSGFVAGDAEIIEKFLLYRTYHGCAMNPAVQAASAAAWNDEAHVVENRRLYREKFAAVTPMLQEVLAVEQPDAAFYLWARTPMSDRDFALGLYRDYNVTILPGSFLAREARSINPGEGFVRIALVAPLAECVDAAQRIQKFINKAN